MSEEFQEKARGKDKHPTGLATLPSHPWGDGNNVIFYRKVPDFQLSNNTVVKHYNKKTLTQCNCGPGMTCLFPLEIYTSTLDACTRQLKGYYLCLVRQLSSKDPSTTTTALCYSSQVVVFPWAEVCPLFHQSLIQNYTLLCLLLWNKMHLQVRFVSSWQHRETRSDLLSPWGVNPTQIIEIPRCFSIIDETFLLASVHVCMSWLSFPGKPNNINCLGWKATAMYVQGNQTNPKGTTA